MASVEKIWKTQAGHKAVVLLVRGSHRCGYVGVPEGHPLYGKTYSDQIPELKVPSDDEPLGDRSPIVAFIAAGKGEYQSMDTVFDVHGGVTWTSHFLDPSRDKAKYSELTETGKEWVKAGLDDGLWYIGYDCAHSGDGTMGQFGSMDGPVRSLEYCEAQCEKLSQQIIERVIYQ